MVEAALSGFFGVIIRPTRGSSGLENLAAAKIFWETK
jgi:hypothetical protein